MTVQILQGDCIEVLPTLGADSIDACVTDPPSEYVEIARDRMNAVAPLFAQVAA